MSKRHVAGTLAIGDRRVPNETPDGCVHVIAGPDGAVREADLVTNRNLTACDAQMPKGERNTVGGLQIAERRAVTDRPKSTAVVVVKYFLWFHVRQLPRNVAVEISSGERSLKLLRILVP